MADRRELCVGGKPISSLRVVDLKVELEKRSLPKSGSKKELLERLRLHLQLEETREAALKDEDHVPNLSLCNETENDFVREYLAAQQARFQVQKEAKKQYEEKVRESEASAEETTQDEDEPSDYSPARKSSPRKSSRSKRKEEFTSTPVAHKEISQFQTPESLATPREEETPSQDDDTTEEEEARTPRTRKHKLLKYVQTPTGSERKQPGNSVTGQGQVEQLHAGRRDPPPSQLYGDAGVASSTDAKTSHSSAIPGSSSKTSSSAESSEAESVFPRLVDVWSEKEKRSEDQTSVPESIPKDEDKPPILETLKKSPEKNKAEEPKEVHAVSETKPVEAQEATEEEASPVQPAEEPAPVVPIEKPDDPEKEEDTTDSIAENTEDSKAVVNLEPEKKEDHEVKEKEIKNTACEISTEDSSKEPTGEISEKSGEMNVVETVEKQEIISQEPVSDAKEVKVDEENAEANKPSIQERPTTPGPVEDVLTIEAEPEVLGQPDSSERKEEAPENKDEETAQVAPSMAIEKERSPQPKARSESRQDDKTEQLDVSAQQTSDNEEDEIQVDASELIDDSLKITDADEGDMEKQEQERSHSRYSSTSRSESRNSDEEKNSTREKETSPKKTDQKSESPIKAEPSKVEPVSEDPHPIKTEAIKVEPVRKLKIKKFHTQLEVESNEATENGGVRKRKWGTSNLLPSKKPALVISTDSLKTIVPDAKPLSAEEVRLGSPNFQSAKQTAAPPVEEEEAHLPKPEKPEIVRRVAVEVAEAIAPAKPEAVIAAAAPLLEATSPSQQPRTCVLQVSNLVRPFTINQLKDLLARTGHLVDGKFWIDKVKSTCLVQYETEDEAEETRTALHGIHWPTSNPKTLIVDFSTVEQLENRMAGKLVPSGSMAKVEQSVRGPAPALATVDENKRERAEKVREWDLGKVSEADADKERFGNENRAADDDFVEVKAKDDVPAKLLDDLFRKTKATPCIYWLPLTDAQIAEKEEMRRQRIAEREKREREVKQRKEEEFQERQREREKQRENERERQRARERERERERDKQRSRKRSHSSSSSSSSGSSSPSPAKRRSSKTPPRRR